MVTKAATNTNIQHGFLSNGLIDTKHRRYPDFNRILSTCRRNPTLEQYQ